MDAHASKTMAKDGPAVGKQGFIALSERRVTNTDCHGKTDEVICGRKSGRGLM